MHIEIWPVQMSLNFHRSHPLWTTKSLNTFHQIVCVFNVSSSLPDGVLFGGTHHARSSYSLPIRNIPSVPILGEGSILTAKVWKRVCVRRVRALVRSECTQLGWVCLNENLFSSAAWNPGLQVNTFCFDLHSTEIWWMPLFFPTFSNQHLVWWSSKMPERPWVMRELRCEWVTVWQWEKAANAGKERGQVFSHDCLQIANLHPLNTNALVC